MSKKPDWAGDSYQGPMPEIPPDLAQMLRVFKDQWPPAMMRIERRFSYHAALHQATLIAERLLPPPASPPQASDRAPAAPTEDRSRPDPG